VPLAENARGRGQAKDRCGEEIVPRTGAERRGRTKKVETSGEARALSSRMGRDAIHPAVFGKSAEPFDYRGFVKRSWYKERKERRESAAGEGKLQVTLEILDWGDPHHPPAICMNIKRKEL